MSSESDAEFLDSMEQWVIGSLVFKREHRDRLFALARRGAAVQWRPIEEAPQDGTCFLAVVDGTVRTVAYGKTSHVPIYGFCVADQGPEDFDICHPTHFIPLPPPPAGATSDE